MPKQEYDNVVKVKTKTETAVEKKVSEDRKERELEERKNRFADSQEELKQKMFKLAEQYGLEDYRTQLMMEFYDVSVQLNESIETVEAVVSVTKMFGKAIGFFDQALSVFDNFYDESYAESYGPFHRIKEYFKQQKAQRNLVNRMNSLTRSITFVQSMSGTMVNAIRTSVDQMKLNMIKNQKKREEEAKKLEAKGIPTVPSNTNSSTANMIKEYLASQGIKQETPVNKPTNNDGNPGDPGDAIF